MLTTSWIYNDWNEKELRRTKNPTSLYFTSAELFYDEEGFNLSHLFKIPYDVLTSLYYTLSKDVHISFSDFDQMPWFWVLMVLDHHREFVEKQNKEAEGQTDMVAEQQSAMERMQRQQQQSMDMQKFSTPQMPDYNAMMNNFKF